MPSAVHLPSARGGGNSDSDAQGGGGVGSRETGARGAMVLMNSPLHTMYICTRRLKLLCWVLAELSSASTLLEDYTRGMLNLARQLVLAWQAVLLAATTQSRLDRRLAGLALDDEARPAQGNNEDTLSAGAGRGGADSARQTSSATQSAPSSRTRRRPQGSHAARRTARYAAHEQARRTRLPHHVYRAVRGLWAEYMDDENEVARFVERIRRVVVAALYQQYLHITVETSEDLLLREGLEPPSRAGRRAELVAAFTRAQREVSAARARRARRKRGRGPQAARATNIVCDEWARAASTERADEDEDDYSATSTGNADEQDAADDDEDREEDDDTLLPVPLSLFMHVATAASPTVRAFHCMSRCVLYARGVHSLDDESPLAQEETQYRRLRERQHEHDADEEAEMVRAQDAHRATQDAATSSSAAASGGAQDETAAVEEHEGYYYVVIAARAVGACAHVQPCFGNCKFMFVQIAYERNFTPGRLARQLNAFANTFAQQSNAHDAQVASAAEAAAVQPSSSTGVLALRQANAPYLQSESDESNSAMSDFYDSFASSAHGTPLGFILRSASHRVRRGRTSRDEADADVLPDATLPPYMHSPPVASPRRRHTPFAQEQPPPPPPRDERAAQTPFADRTGTATAAAAAAVDEETTSEEDEEESSPVFVVMHAVRCSLLTAANAANAPATPAMRHDTAGSTAAGTRVSTNVALHGPTAAMTGGVDTVAPMTAARVGMPAIQGSGSGSSNIAAAVTPPAQSDYGSMASMAVTATSAAHGGLQAQLHRPPGTLTSFEQTILMPPNAGQVAFTGSALSQSTLSHLPLPEMASTTLYNTAPAMESGKDGTAAPGAETEPQPASPRAVVPSSGDLAFADELYARLHFWCVRGQARDAFRVEGTLGMSAMGDEADVCEANAKTVSDDDGRPDEHTRRHVVPPLQTHGAAHRQTAVPAEDEEGGIATTLHLPLKLLIGDVGWISFTATQMQNSAAAAAEGGGDDDTGVATRGVTNLKGQELLYHALTASTEAVVCAVRECRAHHRFHDKLHSRPVDRIAAGRQGQKGAEGAPQEDDEWDSFDPQCTLSEDEYDVFAFDHYTHLGVMAEVRWCQGEGEERAGIHTRAQGCTAQGCTAHDEAAERDCAGATMSAGPHLTAREARQLRNERLKNEFRLARSARLDVLLVNRAQGKPIAAVTLEAAASTAHGAAGGTLGATRTGAAAVAAAASSQATPSAQEAVHSSVYAVTIYSPYVAPLWNYLRQEKMLLVDLDRTLVDNAITLPAAVGGRRWGQSRPPNSKSRSTSSRTAQRHGRGDVGLLGRSMTGVADRPAFFSWPGAGSTANVRADACRAARIEAEELAVMFGSAQNDDYCCACGEAPCNASDADKDCSSRCYYYHQHYGSAPCAFQGTDKEAQQHAEEGGDEGGSGKRAAYALHFERYGPVRYHVGSHTYSDPEPGDATETSDATRTEMIYVRPHLRHLLHTLAIQWAIPLVLVTKSSAARTAAVLSQILDPCGLLFTRPTLQVVSAEEQQRLSVCESHCATTTSPPTAGFSSATAVPSLPSIAEAQKSALEVIRRYDALASEAERVGKTRSVAILDDAPHVWRETCWPYTVSIPPYTLSRIDPKAYFGPNGYLAVLLLSCLYSVRSIVCPHCTACEDGAAARTAGPVRWPHCLCSCPAAHRAALERAGRRGRRSAVFVDEATLTRAAKAAPSDTFASPRRRSVDVPQLLLPYAGASQAESSSTTTVSSSTSSGSSSYSSGDDDGDDAHEARRRQDGNKRPGARRAVTAEDEDTPLAPETTSDTTAATHATMPPYLPSKRHGHHDRPRTGRAHGRHASLSLPPTPSLFLTAASMSLPQTSLLPPLASLPDSTAAPVTTTTRTTGVASSAHAERATLPSLMPAPHHAALLEPDTIAASEAIVEEDDDDSVDVEVGEDSDVRPRVADSEEAVGVVRTGKETAEADKTLTRRQSRHSWWATDDVEDVVPL